MTANKKDVPTLIDQLNDKASAKRRSAAKALRRMRAAEAGPALLAALEKEMADRRTWETQYQMAMALGACRHIEALPLLQRIATMDLDATMVLAGTGDAITRLEHEAGTPFESLRRWLAAEFTRLDAAIAESKCQTGGIAGAVRRWLPGAAPSADAPQPGWAGGKAAARTGYQSPEAALAEGGLQAAAVVPLVPDDALAEDIIRYALLAEREFPAQYAAVICAGLSGDSVAAFLSRCGESANADTRRAAAEAQDGCYMKLQPL